jgi:hypothetical protein
MNWARDIPEPAPAAPPQLRLIRHSRQKKRF